MGVRIDVAWKSLFKYGEELCGDKVEIRKKEDSDIVILADGMGSGVKANILATLTSKILGTMFQEGSTIELAVETIARTLPICKVRGVAYSTFSILQIFHDGKAYLVEFDNPSCVFIRDGQIVQYPYKEREIEGKTIHEYSFEVKVGDCFVLMSDGAIWAGTGELMNYGWTWKEMSEYTLRSVKKTRSASRLAALLSESCDELYGRHPGDDTTVAVVRVVDRKVVNIFTGPPEYPENDERAVHEFMREEGKKVICGGTTSNIVAHVLGREIVTTISRENPELPPTAEMEGVDLITEGVLTLNKVLSLLRQYAGDDIDVGFFEELDADNGASRLAKMLIEECTDIHLFVGKATNEAHEASALPFELSARMNLVNQLSEIAGQLGKKVDVKYY